MSDPREWWINPETFIILDYEPKYDDGMFNVIEKSEYDALKAELGQQEQIIQMQMLVLDARNNPLLKLNGKEHSPESEENERLKAELERAKGEPAYHIAYQQMKDERDQLKAENEKLRVALQRIADLREYLSDKPHKALHACDIARAVLGEKK